jgi:hypothetical protein
MPVKAVNLELQDWAMMGDDGKAPSGLVFVADKIELFAPPPVVNGRVGVGQRMEV